MNKWREKFSIWSLYHREYIIGFVVGFVLGIVLF